MHSVFKLVPIHNYGPGTFKFCTCGEKINTEGRVYFL